MSTEERKNPKEYLYAKAVDIRVKMEASGKPRSADMLEQWRDLMKLEIKYFTTIQKETVLPTLSDLEKFTFPEIK